MSMDIANLVCRELDERMEGLAEKFGLKYTRHCDDINISGKDELSAPGIDYSEEDRFTTVLVSSNKYSNF